MRKHLGIIFFSLVFHFISAQNKNCDCYVKTDKYTLDTKLLIHNLKEKPPATASKPYLYLYPEKDQTQAIHKIVSDSATNWIIQPHIYYKNKYHLINTKKLIATFYIPIQFNNTDSIPVFAEPDKKSKVIHYIKSPINKKEEITRCFIACKPSFAKIKLFEKQSQSGWISKENYLHE